MLKLSV